MAQADAAARPTHQRVASRDGVVAVDLPVDLVVHTHDHSFFGTSADGSRRLYLRHLPGDELIRVAGHTKDALIGRGWEVDGERHFENAIEVRSVHRVGATRRIRVSWFVARGGRVLLCEGATAADGREALEAALRPLCQGVVVEAVAAPAPSADAAP